MAYFTNALDKQRRQLAVSAFQESLKRNPAIQFDTIAGRGVSGITMGSLFAHVVGVNFCAVRKKVNGDGSAEAHCHDYSKVAYAPGYRPERVLLVDDFISSGKTIDEMIKELRLVNSEVGFAGIYLYESSIIRDPYKEIPVISPKWIGHPAFGEKQRYVWEA